MEPKYKKGELVRFKDINFPSIEFVCEVELYAEDPIHKDECLYQVEFCSSKQWLQENDIIGKVNREDYPPLRVSMNKVDAESKLDLSKSDIIGALSFCQSYKDMNLENKRVYINLVTNHLLMGLHTMTL